MYDLTAIHPDPFNGCTGGQEPDWARFRAIHVVPMRDNSKPGDDGTTFEPCDAADDPEMYAITGELHDGDGDLIADCDQSDQAHALAAIFTERVALAAIKAKAPLDSERYAVRLHGMDRNGQRIVVVTDDRDLAAALDQATANGWTIHAAEFRPYIGRGAA
jgi:hypothetical protein